ncbi:c-type cytochrome [Sphingoaurantiacus capsulatus]|uniref:C-type cytochrome n=1 Tax=Sphingoaurantiacus capsulatus TaxID=1771310 RepID=A0ABV7XD30_9SPHN
MKALAVAALAAMIVATPAAAQVVDGKKLFTSRCGVCHWDPAKPGEQARMGPSLSGVVGRKAGTHPKFTRYSKGMKDFGKPWSEALLASYLENPRKTVPGTNMAFVGLKKPEERAAVVAYLKKPR